MSNFVHLGSFGNLVDHGIHPVGHLDSIAFKCALVSRRKLVSEPPHDRIVYSVSAEETKCLKDHPRGLAGTNQVSWATVKQIDALDTDATGRIGQIRPVCRNLG